MAGALFAPMTPGPFVLLRIGSSSTFSNRCRRCPGAGAVELKEAHSPFPLPRAPKKEPPRRGSEGCFRASYLAVPNTPPASLNRHPLGDGHFFATKAFERMIRKPVENVLSVPDLSPI